MYTVNTTLDLNLDNVFYLVLYNGSFDGHYPDVLPGNDVYHITSHEFEIVKTNGSTVSSMAPQSGGANATAQISGLTPVDKIGLGIGLGIGLPLLACLCATVVLLLSKKGKRTMTDPQPQQPQPRLPQYVEQEQALHRKHELGRSASYRLSELGDSTRRLQTPELEGRRAL